MYPVKRHLMWPLKLLSIKIKTIYETGGLVFCGKLKLAIHKYFKIMQGRHVYRHNPKASTLIIS